MAEFVASASRVATFTDASSSAFDRQKRRRRHQSLLGATWALRDRTSGGERPGRLHGGGHRSYRGAYFVMLAFNLMGFIRWRCAVASYGRLAGLRCRGGRVGKDYMAV